MKKNIFIMGSEGVIGSKISSAFEDDFNVFKFDYQLGHDFTKEEVLKCQDGYDGPNYWELFAQFYYSGITVPPYCRQYARPNHPFKTPGMMCLSTDGVWEVQ